MCRLIFTRSQYDIAAPAESNMTCEGRHQIVVGGGSAGCVVASRLAEDVDEG